MSTNLYYIKTNRVFTPLRRYAWLFVLLVAVGGLWYPKLGLLIIPIMLALGVLGFLNGKYWCGNLCPHGSLFDYIIMPVSRNKKIPAFFRSKIMIVLAFSWFMFMLIKRLVRVFAIFGTAPFIDRLGFIFVMNYLMVTVLGTTLALFMSPRTWCSFCPMGTFQVLLYKLGKLLGVNYWSDRKVTVAALEICHKCGKCARVCPMQLEPYREFSGNNQFENEMCIRCSTCVVNCPAGILTLSSSGEVEALRAAQPLHGYTHRLKITAEITDIKSLTGNVNEYTLRFIDPPRVNYKPGQFILLKIQDVPEMYRAYTIASYNEDGRTLRLIIKKVPSGYGTDIIFRRFQVGDKVELEGPLGHELVIDNTAQKILLVANGIGITPFIPIVEDLLRNNTRAREIKLIYGVRHEDEFLYDDYFTRAAASDSRFEYLKIVSRPNTQRYPKGYVTHMVSEMDLKDYKVYICGTKAMTVDMLKLLKSKGCREEDVYYEAV